MSYIATISYFGPYKAAKPWLDQFIALKPTRWQNQTIPWYNASQSAVFGSGYRQCIRGINYNNHYTVGAKHSDAKTYIDVVNQIAKFAEFRPWYNGVFVVQRFNTAATLAVPHDKRGVYPGRELGTLM